MSDLINTIHLERELVEALGGWDGLPDAPPQFEMRIWQMDDYWYIATTNGTHRVLSQNEVKTDEQLIWCVGEHIRILRLPQYRKDET